MSRNIQLILLSWCPIKKFTLAILTIKTIYFLYIHYSVSFGIGIDSAITTTNMGRIFSVKKEPFKIYLVLSGESFKMF